MKRAILWLEKNGAPLTGWILGTVIVGGLILAFQNAMLLLLFTGNSDPSFRQLIGETPVGLAVDGAIIGAVLGWKRAVRWAHEAPKAKPIPPTIIDPILEAARREVEEIAPDV